MIKSMTGFGAVTAENENYTATVEVKSLNSKFLDISTKISYTFSDKEIEIKNLLSKSLERGKINLFLSFINKKNTAERLVVNRILVQQYYNDLKNTAQAVGAPEQDLFRLAMGMPDAYIPAPVTHASEEEWSFIRKAITDAIEACNQFRTQEGKVLYGMLKECIEVIRRMLHEVEAKDPERVEHIREKLRTQVNEYLHSEHFDSNRFEQELIYYIEKLDINEEKVRLRSHLDYFLETMEEHSGGKKLAFIAQEIGREINTIGSKANDATIQHLVVNMKEELEKIKEQLNNVV